MSDKMKEKIVSFAEQAKRILSLEIAARANSLGGYGPSGEVIYEKHPNGCPSVLADRCGSADAIFMSNGSVSFSVKIPEGLDVKVLEGSFDNVEKRETAPLSQNVWLSLGKELPVASLSAPGAKMGGIIPDSIRIVKIGDPCRSMWHCAEFSCGRDIKVRTAIKLALVMGKSGPAVIRGVYVENIGKEEISPILWTYFSTKGTQRFVYNKSLWYDSGICDAKGDCVISCRVPYSDIAQIKAVRSECVNAKLLSSTCDYQSFVGDSGDSLAFPKAILEGKFLGASEKSLTRFSTASIAASQFSAKIAPGAHFCVMQSLSYISDEKAICEFRRVSDCEDPGYASISKSFANAASLILKKVSAPSKKFASSPLMPSARSEYFSFYCDAQKVASEYVNSVWTGVRELYENCRAHGAKLAQGIELGTRDRGQDMWPKMKEDPARVREDLIHVLGFMYQTCEKIPKAGARLSLPQKLHGMFPRQYPSKWDDRSAEVKNDNRPYTDSSLWLVNSTFMFVKESGDFSILGEEVGTIRLVNPEDPINSGIVGNKRRLKVAEVICEIFDSFARHVADSPYGLPQILYGDWCDPVDMFGTSAIGDALTRGKGRGTQIRLSAHCFEAALQAVDLLMAWKDAPKAIRDRIPSIIKLAETIRSNTVKWAWEGSMPGTRNFIPGFINCIHELSKNGKIPDYSRGEKGYTLGSWDAKLEFDGKPRRELGCQAYCLNMISNRRDYLPMHPQADEICGKILDSVKAYHRPELGLVMYTTPIANNSHSLGYVGRMGVLPSGCAENGEYHHCQVMMHRFRLPFRDRTDEIWEQFKPIISALRDENLCGPFEMPSTSYSSDPQDPHYGKGMYFGLSGSTDWIVEIIQSIAGLEINHLDRSGKLLSVSPTLPGAFEGTLRFGRVIHLAEKSSFRKIPFSLEISKTGKNRRQEILINGKKAQETVLRSLNGLKKIEIKIVA